MWKITISLYFGCFSQKQGEKNMYVKNSFTLQEIQDFTSGDMTTFRFKFEEIHHPGFLVGKVPKEQLNALCEI